MAGIHSKARSESHIRGASVAAHRTRRTPSSHKSVERRYQLRGSAPIANGDARSLREREQRFYRPSRGQAGLDWAGTNSLASPRVSERSIQVRSLVHQESEHLAGHKVDSPVCLAHGVRSVGPRAKRNQIAMSELVWTPQLGRPQR